MSYLILLICLEVSMEDVHRSVKYTNLFTINLYPFKVSQLPFWSWCLGKDFSGLPMQPPCSGVRVDAGE